MASFISWSNNPRDEEHNPTLCNEGPLRGEELPISYDESPGRICPVLPSEAREGRALSFNHSLLSWNFQEFRGNLFHADAQFKAHIREASVLISRRVYAMWYSPSLQQLLFLEAVLEEGNFVRAADRLHTTHSTISRSLKSLANGWGIDLFEITPRGLKPNNIGRVYGTQIRKTLEQAKLAFDLARYEPASHKPHHRNGSMT